MTDHITKDGHKIINEKVWNGKQSNFYKGIFDVAHRKVMVNIRADAYPFQSKADAKLFDGNKWNSAYYEPSTDVMDFNPKGINETQPYYKLRNTLLEGIADLFEEEDEKQAMADEFPPPPEDTPPGG